MSFRERRRRARFGRRVLYVILISPRLEESWPVPVEELTYSIQHLTGRRYKYLILLVDRAIIVT